MVEGKNGLIKRAVKEALDDKRLDDLGKSIASLATQVTEGFAKVQTRQDIADGRVGKSETSIATLQEKFRDSNAFRTWLIPVLTAIVTGLAVFVVTH